MFTKLNPEPTDKWSVLKFDKIHLCQNHELGTGGQAPVPRI